MGKSDGTHKKEARALRLFHAIRITSDRLEFATADLLANNGLTIGQFLIMEVLCHNGPMNQTSLATLIGRSGGNVTFIVRNLVKTGLVRQETTVEDRRHRRISMTSEGYDLFMSIYPAFIDIYTQISSAIDAKDQKRLLRTCQSISDAITATRQVDLEADPEHVE